MEARKPADEVKPKTRRVKLADVIKAGLERLGLSSRYVLFKRDGRPELRVAVDDAKRGNDQ